MKKYPFIIIKPSLLKDKPTRECISQVGWCCVQPDTPFALFGRKREDYDVNRMKGFQIMCALISNGRLSNAYKRMRPHEFKLIVDRISREPHE